MGQVFLAGGAFDGFLGSTARVVRSLLIELIGAQRRISEN